MSSNDLIKFYGSTSWSPNDWVLFAQHVIAELEVFLGVTVRFEHPLVDYVRDGVAMDIACFPKTSGDFRLSMKGILASNVQNEKPTMRATIFMYYFGKRLAAKTGEDFIDLEYKYIDGSYIWSPVGWFRDEYAEYAEFDEA